MVFVDILLLILLLLLCFRPLPPWPAFRRGSPHQFSYPPLGSGPYNMDLWSDTHTFPTLRCGSCPNLLSPLHCLSCQKPLDEGLIHSPPPSVSVMPSSTPPHSGHIYPNDFWKNFCQWSSLRYRIFPLVRHRTFTSPLIYSSLTMLLHDQRFPPLIQLPLSPPCNISQ